ncbi:MAG: dihydrolipoyllysine-residue acetyltransferase [Thermomonas sp.]|uniref:dihydrolipoyllysine-residue acetyltransferase n=1 Tax=Thermomonas sp. TaxID=1971895 RepID=UPI001ED00895|nr:dihydrolipoyllysine-residue acetyltransferase [Thermomonas sp.]MBV2208790.1 dihydrolipoyllysine-residue acetyltransferase [Thermomonas sp.]
MAELKEARVPDIGSHGGVPIIELLVKPGDTVSKDQGLVTMESDKATMEVPSPFAGVIKELKVKLGDSVEEGALVAIIEVAEEAAAPAAKAKAPKPAPEAPKPAPVAAPAPVMVESGAPVPAMAPVAEPGQVGIPPMRFEADAVLPAKVPYASPAVRLFARELGVNLAQVSGSARGGRISKEDVQNFVKAALVGGAAPVAAAGGVGGGLNLLPWPKVDFAKFGTVESKPLSRIQKISGANLARNWAMIPHVTQHDDADITELEALRVALNEENAKAIAAGKAGKLTMLAFLIKACVAALQKFPTFNASLDGDNLVLKQYFHIGFAADTPNGLVVPVLRDADQKGVAQIAKEMGELAALAREGKLKPEQMQGGCFTISSLGGIGGTKFTPIINAPEVAILGVSKSEIKPVWDGKAFQPKLMLPLSLSYDHRVIDGAAAARFTTYLGQLLADLRRAML